MHITYGVNLGGGFLAFPREVVKVPPNKLCRSVPFATPSTLRLFQLLLLCLLARLELSNGSRLGDLGKAEEVESAAEELLLETVSSFTVDDDSVERPKRRRRCLLAEGPFSPCERI